ncbi:HAAS signaling domain-containing protein [Cellulomonas citrea]|uniref:HAAS signaling domain-containing protein n=1 Tax=Cellulomonas citrea TaxID=1909423 RepID=UPI001358BFCE|nr:hypothetical protein [Cellulomonas citrea]
MEPAAERAATRYLDDLGRMLTPAPPVQRAEVLAQVREHLDEAFAELGPEPTEAQVRQVLADLGPAEQIAADVLPATPPATPLLARAGLPWVVVGLMALGFVPPFGWLAMVLGLVLFLVSPLWHRAWKVGGTLAYVLVPLLLWGAMRLGTATDPSVESPSVLMPSTFLFPWLILLVPLGWVVVAVVLAVRVSRRPRPTRG